MTQPAYLRWLHWEPGKNPRDPEERSAKSARTPNSTPFGTFGTPVYDPSPKKTAPEPITGGLPSALEPAMEAIRQHRDEALRLLQSSAWSPECLAAGRKFNIPSAKLYPLLNHLVLTPEGAGILLQVFDDRVQVHFESEARTREFRPEQIAVPDDAQRTQGGTL